MTQLRAWLRAWRVPLRIARRDAKRARGRSILVLVMIALPVLAVTAADVVMHTQDVGGLESMDRRLGAAEARVIAQTGAGKYVQAADPDENAFSLGSGEGESPALPAAEVKRILGDARLVELRSGELRVVSDKGVTATEATEIDLDDPVAAGLFDLTSGRLPRSSDEVVVNRALTEKGYAVGDRLELEDDDARDPQIVGIVESTTVRDYPVAVGPLDSLGQRIEGSTTWLVDGDQVTWEEVRRLNAGGATALSRQVMLNPPPSSQVPEEVRSSGGGLDQATLAVVVLVVVMALIEVVLLAGPAFAVGARRQARSLALLAATGGTPKQARRVVLASAVVLGATAAALGTALGIAAAAGLVPVLQLFSTTWFGPFQVPWLQLAGIATFGLVSALLAAVVPAHIASRQDIVAVLAGRRGDRAPSLRSPLVGLLLVAIGVAGAVTGATQTGGETLIAASAIFSVLGMILLVPLLLAGLSRLSHRLPLTLRYAVRDAARHRTRTVPAVAAVAATVAGVVALGIANASDAAENEATYTPSTTAGLGVMTSYGEDPDWPAYQAIVTREVTDATMTGVRGLPSVDEDGVSNYVLFTLPGSEDPLLASSGSALGSDLLVSDDEVPPGLVGISDDGRSRASAALREGGLVVFTHATVPAGTAQVRATVQTYDTVGDGSEAEERKLTLPATFVRLEGAAVAPQAIASTAAARTLGIPVAQVGLAVSGVDITPAEEEAITEGAAAISPDAYFSVERGFQAEDATRIVQLILAALGAVLMLGGTLTATFLALSDARPDLATLSAVGASPRARRGVAAAYALVVGAVGATLGAVVGFIPGIAIAHPLTRTSGTVIQGSGPMSSVSDLAGGTGPFVDIPWLLIVSLVVLLPLLTAAIVGLSARSRLPLVARLD